MLVAGFLSANWAIAASVVGFTAVTMVLLLRVFFRSKKHRIELPLPIAGKMFFDLFEQFHNILSGVLEAGAAKELSHDARGRDFFVIDGYEVVDELQ